MYKVFETLEEFNAKNQEINNILGYPTEDRSTLNYSDPIETADNKYAMPISEEIKHLFDDSELASTICIKVYDPEDSKLINNYID